MLSFCGDYNTRPRISTVAGSNLGEVDNIHTTQVSLDHSQGCISLFIIIPIYKNFCSVSVTSQESVLRCLLNRHIIFPSYSGAFSIPPASICLIVMTWPSKVTLTRFPSSIRTLYIRPLCFCRLLLNDGSLASVGSVWRLAHSKATYSAEGRGLCCGRRVEGHTVPRFSGRVH